MLRPPLLLLFLVTLLQGQDVKALSRIVTSQLRTLNSPFIAVPAPAFAPAGAAAPAVEELHFAADALAVAEWLRGPNVTVALGMLSQSAAGLSSGLPGSKGVDGMLAAQEDAQRELKCRQALLSVQAFESSCQVNVQVRVS